MVLEAVRAGVPQGVVQPGRALERRLPVQRRVDPARPGSARSGTGAASSPPVRNFSRSSASATSSAAASQLGAELLLRELDVHRGLLVEHPVGAGGVDARRPPGGRCRRGRRGRAARSRARPRPAPLRPARCSGAADRAGAAGDHDRQRERRVDVRDLDVGDDERADQVGVPLVASGRRTPPRPRAAARHRAGRSRRRRPGRGRRRGQFLEALGQPTASTNDAGQTRAARPRLASWSAMISRCTSLAPSQIRSTRSSRKNRSATFSRM